MSQHPSAPSPEFTQVEVLAPTVPPLAFTSPPHPTASSSASVVSISTAKDGESSDDASTLDEKTSIPELTASKLEKAEAWEGYLEDPLPEKTDERWLRNLRHQIFSLYRRFFGVIFVANALILIISLARGGLSTAEVGKTVIGNLLVAIIFRQDHFVNLLFGIFCRVPISWPLWIRSTCAEIYHIGGIHSGCSFSATVWFIYFSVKITQDFVHHVTSVATLVVTYVILSVLVAIIFFAWPGTRVRKHNTFETTHRFAGWLATALLWVHTILLTNDTKKPSEALGTALVHTATFWMVVVITGSIILPWTNLRKVNVRPEVLSNHAVRLYFDYAHPVPGSYARLSLDPLTEWHSFATIRIPGEKGYSSVVSRAGDWTSKRIDNPPTKIWVRGVPVSGVMRIVPLFRRVVIVATGSGMGPCAPHVFAKQTPIRLLWTAPNVRQTFGDKFVDAVVEANPEAVIYDTRKHGKPDMVKLTYRLVKEFNAEAVCIISNPALTYKVVYGMRSRGIPAYGAIWDS